MPRLALCVIAKNEAQFIGGCIASAADAVDQVIVVDTGSTDDTVEIAKRHGATIVNFPWVDDFSRARNAALPHVQADWVLILDADERLASGAGPSLKAAAASNQFDCGLLPLHNASSLDASEADVLIGKARMGEPLLLPRLFRYTQDLRWEGAIHELPTSWMKARGRTASEVPAPIIHFGSIPSVRARLKKDVRNLELLKMRCRENPRDHIGRTYLARELVRVGDIAGARDTVDQAWELRRAEGLEGGGLIPLATLRSHLQLQAGDGRGALETMNEAARHSPPHPNIDLIQGAALELLAAQEPPHRRAHLEGAKGAFINATKHHGKRFSEEVLPGGTSWVAATRLAVVLIQLGDPESALYVIDRTLKEQPKHADAILTRIEALIALGRNRDALTEVEGALPINTGDSWLLAAICCDNLGATNEAKMFIERAASRQEAGFTISPHRAETFRQLHERLFSP